MGRDLESRPVLGARNVSASSKFFMDEYWEYYPIFLKSQVFSVFCANAAALWRPGSPFKEFISHAMYRFGEVWYRAGFSTAGIFRMALDSSEVEKIAQLARLALDESQLAAYTKDLSNILDLVAQLESADTGRVAPMAHPLHMVQRLREDRVTEADRRVENQAIAPLVEAGLYLVPKVIE
jgi:aspartyl-tRNA(Asn)/glutamyl-tRNA(Gln) amidotransferase subunit C